MICYWRTYLIVYFIQRRETAQISIFLIYVVFVWNVEEIINVCEKRISQSLSLITVVDLYMATIQYATKKSTKIMYM